MYRYYGLGRPMAFWHLFGTKPIGKRVLLLPELLPGPPAEPKIVCHPEARNTKYIPLSAPHPPPPPRFSIWSLRPVAAIALLAGVFLFVALAFTALESAKAEGRYAGPVQNLRVTADSTTKLTVTWSVPSDDGGYIDKYQIEASATADGAYSATGVSPSEVNFDAVRTSTVTVDAHSTERTCACGPSTGRATAPGPRPAAPPARASPAPCRT